MKKALSFVLTLAMVLSIVPMFGGIAFASASGNKTLDDVVNGQLEFDENVYIDDNFLVIEQSGARHIILRKDVSFSESENLVIVATTTDIVLRLEGHSIKRNLTTPTDAGFVIKVASGSDLTILGELGEDKLNKITGGNNNSSGGGIYVEENGTLTIIGPVDISGNKAKNGGGIYAEKDSNIDLRKASITFSNDSAEKGGALYLETYAHIKKETSIKDSVATYGGAVYVANNGWCEIENVIISTCSAIGDGARGGAVYVEHGGTATFIVGTKVENCTATDLGGAIYAEGAVGLEKCTICNNSVQDAGAGAGIYLCSQGSLFLGSTANVKENTKGDTPNNVLVCSGASLFFGTGNDVTAPAIGMEIGISLETIEGNVPTFSIASNSEEYKNYLKFENIDTSKYEFKYENSKLILCEKPTPPTPVHYNYGPTYYSVSSSDSTNGSFKVDKSSMYSGGKVTVTVTPDKGFVLETLTVLDKNGKEIEVKDLGDNKYSFTMPSGKVDISATFMEDNRMLNHCVDVKVDDYYYDAVLWAYENKICNGIDELHFNPLGIASRAEMLTFMWRAAGSPEPKTTTCNFTDVDSSKYYYKAVLWAYENGITDGTSETTFSPGLTVDRAQTVTFLARFAGVKDSATGYSHDFTDVPADEYYSNAVAWAYKNKITDGTGENKFSPFEDCQRGQVVTFLYRNFVK